MEHRFLRWISNSFLRCLPPHGEVGGLTAALSRVATMLELNGEMRPSWDQNTEHTLSLAGILFTMSRSCARQRRVARPFLVDAVDGSFGLTWI